MFFSMPVPVYSEVNCIQNHQAKLCALGTKALIVTGRRSAKENGSLQDVQTVLEANNMPYVIFDQVEENPSTETVMAARDFGLTEGVDFIIGIGGGSPLDAAKAIGVMIRHHDKGVEFLHEKPAKGKSIPMAAIPTTCGTGSEVTQYSVLTVHAKQTKVTMTHRVFPDIALIDPRYLMKTPLSILRNTAMDALGHLVESYIHTAATNYSRILVRAGLAVWKKNQAVLLGEEPITIEACENLMMASTLAGMAIAHTGTSLPHGLSYCLTYELGVPHGKAVGYFIAGYLREANETDRNEILSTAGFADLAALEAFYAVTCGNEKMPAELLNKTVAVLCANTAKLKSCPFPLDESKIHRIAGLQ